MYGLNVGASSYTPTGSGNIDIESFSGSGFVGCNCNAFSATAYTHYLNIYIDGAANPSYSQLIPSGFRGSINIPLLPFKLSYRINFQYTNTDVGFDFYRCRYYIV